MDKEWSSPYSKDTNHRWKVFVDKFRLHVENFDKEDLGQSTVTAYDISFDKKQFKELAPGYIKKRSDTESPKFNIKIRKNDLLLIDEIAKDRGNTRTEVINYLLYQHLLNELKSVKDSDDEKENKKLQMLLAARADAITHNATYPDDYLDCYFDPMGWSGDLLGDVLEKVFSDFYNYGEMKTSAEENIYTSEQSESQTETYKKIYEKLIEDQRDLEEDNDE